jgi:hypothetical protein
VNLSKVQLTVLLDGSCFLFASTVSEYSVRQREPQVLGDASNSSLHNALYDHCFTWLNIVFDGIQTKLNPTLWLRPQVSW